MERYRIYYKDQKVKSLIVDENVHALVTMFAKNNKITMTEAVYYLLGKALAIEAGLDDNSPQKPRFTY